MEAISFLHSGMVFCAVMSNSFLRLRRRANSGMMRFSLSKRCLVHVGLEQIGLVVILRLS